MTIQIKQDKRKKTILKLLIDVLFAIFMIGVVLTIVFTLQARAMNKEPSILGHKFYTVDSGSMSPTIPVGSLIVVKQVSPQEIQARDIITFRGYSSGIITHRTREVLQGGDGFITRGDGNQSNDPMPVKEENLIGKVVFHIPFIGYLLNFLSSLYGLITLLGVIGISILLPKLKTSKPLETKQ